MCDTESIIVAVEKYPCLWDITNEDYHNHDLKDLAWDEVYKDVYEDWEITDPCQKKKRQVELKKKWTNVRDYYRKDLYRLKNTPAGSVAKKQKRYVYADVLSFLEPVFNKKSHEGNYEIEHGEIKTESLGEELMEPTDTQSLNSSVKEEEIQEMLPVTRRNTRVPKKDVPNQISNLLNESLQSTEDDDTKFLLSFRSDMKAMTKIQKIDFKIGMLQLVKDIYNSTNISSTPISSPTYT